MSGLNPAAHLWGGGVRNSVGPLSLANHGVFGVMAVQNFRFGVNSPSNLEKIDIDVHVKSEYTVLVVNQDISDTIWFQAMGRTGN